METDKIMDESTTNNSSSPQFTTSILYDPARKKEPSPTFQIERDTCLSYFTKWNESDQVDFVEKLLSRMCHYQHGHINAYLKPMLQRDFITLLPSKFEHNPQLAIFFFDFYFSHINL